MAPHTRTSSDRSLVGLHMLTKRGDLVGGQAEHGGAASPFTAAGHPAARVKIGFSVRDDDG